MFRLGHWGARLWRRRRRIALGALALGSAMAAIVLLWPMDVESCLRADPSGEMLDRSGNLLCAFLNEEQQWRFPRELREISPHLVRATLATEDRRFYRHPGVDPFAVLRAMWQNARRGRIVSGASTLSMQVVKPADRPERSWRAKIWQAVQAVRLELRTDKDSILGAYLNRAPYGLNLNGCEAAARRYFGKPSSELTLAEAALIAGLPKAPNALMPLSHPQAARQRRDYVLRRMREEGFISEEEMRRASQEPLGAAWHSFPMLSPHLAMRLKPLIARQGRLRTTLDRDTQGEAARLAREALERFRGQIGNAAVVVIDAPSACVLAHVGSGDFYQAPGGGQVDASRAERSPGSALKPFTYALAMERNCLYPCEILLDAPLDYGQFNPENFDRQHRGLVTASEALRRSLNVPAIVALERVGIENAQSFLKSAGLTTLRRPAAEYGLGLTLGSCETRLEELASAYTMLANLGEYRPLSVRADSAPRPAQRLLSPGACSALYEMLEQPLPDELDQEDVQAAASAPRVCWKTGTSTGRRDAWAFVFNRHYVVGVWMGNNDGRPSNRLVGAQAALPLAARVFRSLKPKNEPAWPSGGEDLRPLRVCAASGLPASPWCAHTKEALVARAQYAHRVCDVHRPAPAEAGGAPRTIERWPASARHWDLANVSNAASSPLPEGRADNLKALSILTPSDKAEFVLTGETEGDCVRLRSSVDQREIAYWYLNEAFLGQSAPEEPLLLDLKPGKHKLACMTPDGLTDSVEFDVLSQAPSGRFK